MTSVEKQILVGDSGHAAPGEPWKTMRPPDSFQRILERARAYVRTMEPSIQGQRGSDAAFRVAVALRRGFGLDSQTSLEIFLGEFNPRCLPPWSEREARHKIEDAGKGETGSSLGYLIGAPAVEALGRASHSERITRLSASRLQSRSLTLEECKAIAADRGLHGPGIWLASKLGVIRAAKYRGNVVWYVCDQGGNPSVIRRIDGRLIGDHRTHCLVRGDDYHRPYGFVSGWNGESFALGEGPTDFLALWEQAVWEQVSCVGSDPFSFGPLGEVLEELNCLPLMMISATARIRKAKLQKFKGKRVRVFTDNDGAANRAARELGRFLSEVAESVDMFDCGDWIDKPGADFNDCYQIVAERVLP